MEPKCASGSYSSPIPVIVSFHHYCMGHAKVVVLGVPQRVEVHHCHLLALAIFLRTQSYRLALVHLTYAQCMEWLLGRRASNPDSSANPLTEAQKLKEYHALAKVGFETSSAIAM